MGLGNLLKNIASSANEAYSDKMKEVDVYSEKMIHLSNQNLFEILYKYHNIGNFNLLNSEGIAAMKMLRERGYQTEEITDEIKRMNLRRNRR